MKTHNFIIGPSDTDSISFCKKDNLPFSKEELEMLLKELNDISPEFIEWEDDGYYKTCIALKAKNYILYDGVKKVVKGSAFKTSSKEIALKEFMEKVVQCILDDQLHNLINIYHDYVKEATNPVDIKRWCQKKGASEAVLKCKGYEKHSPEKLKEKAIRPNETNIWDAIKMEELVQTGDKFYLYPVILEKNVEIVQYKNGKSKEKIVYKYGYRQSKHWNNQDHDVDQLLKRVYDTLSIFETVLDLNEFLDYSKTKNKESLKLLTTVNKTDKV